MMLVATISGCQSSGSSSKFGIAKNLKKVPICSGFGCIYQQSLAFSVDDMMHINSIMNNSNASARDERAALANLIGWKEQLAQRRLGMRQDTRLSYQVDAGIRGQMDCVDESSNTLAFLNFLNSENLLRYHKPKRIGARGYLFDGRYPHKTATATDDKGIVWAFDSWKKNGGEPPQVVEYSSWKLERASEYRKPG